MSDRHSYPHTAGPRVADLLQRALDHGEPIRLAWPQPHAPALDRDDYPTAELPAIPAADLTAAPADGESACGGAA